MDGFKKKKENSLTLIDLIDHEQVLKDKVQVQKIEKVQMNSSCLFVKSGYNK